MKLRKLVPTMLVALATTISFSGYSNDLPVLHNKTATETPVSPEAQKLLNRLEEMKGMDFKNMPRSERKALKKEIKGIEKELKTMDGGYIYISAAGLVLIILLLLILL